MTLNLPQDDETQHRENLLLVEGETPIKGRPAEIVQAVLEARGFKVKIETRETGEGPPGTVLERNPPDQRLEKGSEITLVVAQAPANP